MHVERLCAALAVCALPVAALADDTPAAAPSPPPALTGVTFGGDVRERYEHYFDKQWDPRQGSNGYLLQRYTLHAGAYDGRLTGFLEVEHSAASGAHGPVDPTWRDDFAAPQAYLEYAIGGPTGTATPPLAIRIGRQRLAYGVGRIIDDRDGLNTYQAFDGVRARVRAGGLTVDAFAVHPVGVTPGSFDDLPKNGDALWGAYATERLAHGSFEAYYLGDQRSLQAYYRGAGPEVRDTLGARYVVQVGHFDGDTEGDYQFGAWRGDPIVAWSLATSLGWSFPGAQHRYRVGFDAGIATGDHDPAAHTFTAFRPPYPTGLTFGLIQANGPIDVGGFALTQQYVAHAKLTLTAKEFFYYRQSTADGLYSPPSFPLRAPAGSAAVPIGQAGFVSANDAFDRHVTASVAYARYFAGAFLMRSGPARGVTSANTSYFSTSLDYRF